MLLSVEMGEAKRRGAGPRAIRDDASASQAGSCAWVGPESHGAGKGPSARLHPGFGPPCMSLHVWTEVDTRERPVSIRRR